VRERDSRPELRKEEVEQSRSPSVYREQRHTESRDRKQRAETELTGGGGSEKQRVEERESGVEIKRREIEWLRKVREKIFKFEIYAKRRRFGSPRTGPDPYQTRTGKIFFLAEIGYAWGTHAAVPWRYTYPRRTRYRYGAHFAVPVLPRVSSGS
jgi:hypothetical protein